MTALLVALGFVLLAFFVAHVDDLIGMIVRAESTAGALGIVLVGSLWATSGVWLIVAGMAGSR